MIQLLNKLFKKNKSKRVIPFFDYFDNIPYNAKYLFSLKQEIQTPESEDEKTKRLISNNPEELNKTPIISYLHYYEVNDEDFEVMKQNDYLNLTAFDKIQRFKKECNIK